MVIFVQKDRIGGRSFALCSLNKALMGALFLSFSKKIYTLKRCF